MSREDKFLVDTDITIYWLNNKYPQIDQKIRTVGDDTIFISSITVAELFYGAYNSSNPAKNLKLVNELILDINIINFDSKAGKQFGTMKAELKKIGKIINDSDLFIAATAISNDMILVTNNEKHFQRIKNLKIENWSK
ncbi:MAG: type II toxin-antitoxin system VapC family toxin [Desulfosarcina sp.]|nr:type II toxin-antitoxin system VapC family toxin [Desulfobacterales bacterium]